MSEEKNITPQLNPEADDPVADATRREEAPHAEVNAEADAPMTGASYIRHIKVPRGKLQSFNYLADVPGGFADCEFVEVLFKNTRKGFYKNPTGIPLAIGDWVAVEAAPGHDIGRVSMVGALVKLQMRKAGVKNPDDCKRVFRKARPADMEKFEEAKARENSTMIRSRKIASSLQLNMKIGDVEYQGDGNKAIFYYIADERVDFRQLIKVLAETFKVRIEMKQIGARQEAGRIGGIGPCGRPLCCSTWMTNFVSVATSAARYQDISLNPQKLAGQCAKLKCCLNFEVDTYVESVKRMPPKDVRLETADSTYFYFKVDIFKREITYSTDKSVAANLVTIDADRAFEVMRMNKAGEKPLSLKRDGEEQPAKQRYNDILDQDNLTRFDKKKKKKTKSQRRPEERSADGARAAGERTAADALQTGATDDASKERQPRDRRRDGNRPPRDGNRDNREPREGNRNRNNRRRDNRQQNDERAPKQQPQQGQPQPPQSRDNSSAQQQQ